MVIRTLSDGFSSADDFLRATTTFFCLTKTGISPVFLFNIHRCLIRFAFSSTTDLIRLTVQVPRYSLKKQLSAEARITVPHPGVRKEGLFRPILGCGLAANKANCQHRPTIDASISNPWMICLIHRYSRSWANAVAITCLGDSTGQNVIPALFLCAHLEKSSSLPTNSGPLRKFLARFDLPCQATRDNH